MVTFTQKDIEAGKKKCEETDCHYTHLLEAGMDYPDESWISCYRCDCFVVDESKDNIGCDILSKD